VYLVEDEDEREVSFPLEGIPVEGSLMVFRNGILLIEGDSFDYLLQPSRDWSECRVGLFVSTRPRDLVTLRYAIYTEEA
jgi:hypothetical protein